MNKETVEKSVKEATQGNKQALERIINAIENNIYNLALRMLVNPEDAKDATQEILIKIITNLSSFRFESHFNTWVYRIASNHLLTEKKLLERMPLLTFEEYKIDLESDLQEPGELQNDPDYFTLVNELRISCTMAMLLCLKPNHRMAYILGDILELDHTEASDILELSKDNFRKQLSRSREKIFAFTTANCGLASRSAKCNCEKKLSGAISRKRVNQEHIFFSTKEQIPYNKIQSSLQETQQSLRALSLQTSIRTYKSPLELSRIIELLVDKGIKKNEAH